MELAWPGPRRAHNSVAAAKVPHRRSPDALLPQVESKSGMSYFMPYYIATKRAKVDSAKKREKGEGNHKDKEKVGVGKN